MFRCNASPFIKLPQFAVAKDSLEAVVDVTAKERTQNLIS